MIDHFYIRLKEKWLYHNPLFKSLLKYFKIEKKDNEGKVSLITRIDEKPDDKLNDEYQKYIFKYIEKFFITRRFVEKALKQYVNTTMLNGMIYITIPILLKICLDTNSSD